MPEIFVKTLRDYRWQVFWYGFGFAAMAAMVTFIYPSYRGQLADLQIPEALKPFIGNSDYGTPKGFLNAEFFSWIPILGVVFAVMAGTSALAGEEAAGTLELLLAQPISRSRVGCEKLAGLAVSTFAIVSFAYVGWLVSVPFVAIDISLGLLLRATLLLVPPILLFITLAMWASAALPDRRLATGVISAFAVGSYFLNYVASLVDVLAPLRWASVFFYANGANTLTDPQLWKAGVLLVLTALFALLAIATFEAREIGVHGGVTWPGLTVRKNDSKPRARCIGWLGR